MTTSLPTLLDQILHPARITSNDISQARPGIQGDGINYIYRILRGIYANAFSGGAITPITNTKHHLYVTKNADDKWGGDPQAAIDSITDATFDEPYLVEILSPGVYNGNFVLKDHVSLVALNADAKQVILSSSSGDTLQMPVVNSSLLGITCRSTSTNTSDTGIRLVAQSSTARDNSYLVLSGAYSTNQAKAIIVDSGGGGGYSTIAINFIVTANQCALAIEVNAGIFAWLVGALIVDDGFAGPETMMLVNSGAAHLGTSVNYQSAAGTGWTVDVNGGVFVTFAGILIQSGGNGLRFRNAGQGVLNDANQIGNPSGTPLDIDATSFVFMGVNAQIDGLGFPAGFGGTGWVVNGSLFNTERFDKSSGTSGIGGTDQRLTALGFIPPGGTQFFATDAAMGGGPGTGVALTYATGTGWIDFSSFVHP